jgi:hypothetical protein
LSFSPLTGKTLTTTGTVSPGIKRPQREADRQPPTSAEIKEIWIYTPPPICLHGVVLN